MAATTVAAQERVVPCASCVVFEVAGPGTLPAAVLEPLATAGARLAVAIRPGDALPSGAGLSVVVIEPRAVTTPEEGVFGARTLITEIRAGRPNLLVALDGDGFAAAAIPVGPLRSYVDAVVGQSEGWRRTARVERPTVEELVRLSLTPGVDRVVIPLGEIDAGVLVEFAARAAVPVDVRAARPLTAGEIIARHQAQRRRQDEVVRSTIASGTTVLTFELPGFAAPMNITADTTIFAQPGQTDIEHKNLLVNGSTIAGGNAAAAPALPLIEPERVGTAPLVIALTDAYRYELQGEDTVDGDRTYVVRFEPVTAGVIARGQAWIDATDFSLRRLQVIQAALRGPIVSSEQVEEFGAFTVEGRDVRLPVQTKIFQMYDGAGYRTPIHRTIDLPRYDVNPADFDARLADAHASSSVMLRETPQGLKYLLKDEHGARQVALHAGQRIRAVVFGVFLDPNISQPLPFAGLSYIDLNLFGTGAQVSAFFAGIYGEATWSVPSIRGSRWQLDGGAFGIATRYYDRVFRDGVERYSENIRQRPAHVSVSAMHPLAARFRVRAGYDLDVVGFYRGTSTERGFRVPPTAVTHGFLGALEAERGPWSARVWWNPATRQGWRQWGLPGTFDAGQRDFQRYGVNVTRTLKLRPVLSSRLDMSWMAGHDLDRFSLFSFNSFDNRLHGYPAASVRYDRAVIVRSVTSVGRKGVRLDGFADMALVRDPGYGDAARGYPGVGAAIELAGPLRTLWSVEWGYGIKAKQPDGQMGTQSWQIMGYRIF